MFCIKCGTKLPENAEFCFRCGKKVPIDFIKGVDTKENLKSEDYENYEDYDECDDEDSEKEETLEFIEEDELEEDDYDDYDDYDEDDDSVDEPEDDDSQDSSEVIQYKIFARSLLDCYTENQSMNNLKEPIDTAQMRLYIDLKKATELEMTIPIIRSEGYHSYALGDWLSDTPLEPQRSKNEAWNVQKQFIKNKYGMCDRGNFAYFPETNDRVIFFADGKHLIRYGRKTPYRCVELEEQVGSVICSNGYIFISCLNGWSSFTKDVEYMMGDYGTRYQCYRFEYKLMVYNYDLELMGTYMDKAFDSMGNLISVYAQEASSESIVFRLFDDNNDTITLKIKSIGQSKSCSVDKQRVTSEAIQKYTYTTLWNSQKQKVVYDEKENVVQVL